jgi:hypothetical protein
MAFTINGTSGLTFPNATQQATAAFSGANTNAVSSSAITLSSSSSQYQVAQISSFTNSYMTLPDATQVGPGSNPYVIENRSPYGAKLEIRNNAGTVVGYVGIAQIATVQLKDASTAAGQWAVELVAPQTFFAYNSASITNTTTTPVGGGGLVGLSSTSFVRWWTVTTGNGGTTAAGLLYTQAATISGSTITFGSIQSATIVSSVNTNGGVLSVNARVVRLSNTAFTVLYGYNGVNQAGCSPLYTAGQRILVCSVAGTSVTFGTPSAASMPSITILGQPNVGNAYSGNGTICRLSDTSFGLFYNDAAVDTYGWPYGYSGSMSCQIVTVSGVTLTIGTKVQLGTSTYSQVLSVAALSSTSVFLCYGQAAATGGSTGRSKMVVASVSGTVPTFGTPVSVESSDVTCFNTLISYSNYGVDSAVAPSATQVVFTTGYSTCEGTVSGTVPTFDSAPYGGVLAPIYLCTSSKAYNPNAYLSITTGGFVTNVSVTQVLQTNLSVTQAYPGSPLGAQPTTAFVAYKTGADSSVAASTVILGNTT